MPKRVNIIIPDHLIEQWEAIPPYERSRWVQQKLEDEYEQQKKLEAADAKRD